MLPITLEDLFDQRTYAIEALEQDFTYGYHPLYEDSPSPELWHSHGSGDGGDESEDDSSDEDEGGVLLG